MRQHKETQEAQAMRFPAFLVLFLLLLLVRPSFAEETPEWEFFGGYSILRTNVREYYKSTPIIYSINYKFENLNGWDFSFTENINHWFGGTFDVSGHYKTPVFKGSPNQQQIHSLMYGPRFSLHTSLLTPFAHALFGAAHANVQVTPVGPHASDWSFATAAGGGVDLNVKGFAIRLIQAEYFHANGLGSNQNNYRASAGIVFHAGKSK
jgi:hypothetical protein